MISSSQAFEIGQSSGISVGAYVDRWRARDAEPMKGLDRTQRTYRFYARYNLERLARVQEQVAVGDALAAAVDAVEEPQFWLYITEDWCADAAYSLPVFVAAAALNPLITLRLIERDRHLDVMERYLTGGAQSIPMVAAFAPDGSESFVWGPRPAALSQERLDWESQQVAGREVSAKTIAWYEADGWRQVEGELTQALSRAGERVSSAG